VEQKVTYIELERLYHAKSAEIEVDSALHMIIGAFLDGVAKILAGTAEVESSPGQHGQAEVWTGIAEVAKVQL
jgi:ribosomal protein S8E